jgi:hypothetical protein
MSGVGYRCDAERELAAAIATKHANRLTGQEDPS